MATTFIALVFMLLSLWIWSIGHVHGGTNINTRPMRAAAIIDAALLLTMFMVKEMMATDGTVGSCLCPSLVRLQLVVQCGAAGLVAEETESRGRGVVFEKGRDQPGPRLGDGT
jgi:hypothetical protein